MELVAVIFHHKIQNLKSLLQEDGQAIAIDQKNKALLIRLDNNAENLITKLNEQDFIQKIDTISGHQKEMLLLQLRTYGGIHMQI